MKASVVRLLATIYVAVCSVVIVSADTAGIVANATLRQVRPWQGLVEVGYELTEDKSAEANLSTSVTITDRTTGMTYVAKTFTHPFTYTKGMKRMIWNAAADGVSFKSTDVVCTVEVTQSGALYEVIDLSGGPNATSYPVTTLADVPAGGWSDEYKTTKLVLRRIEAGTFTMGSPSGEVGCYFNETQHQVTLTKAFYIGVFEVTQRQWELVMGTKPSWFNNASCYAARPVENVSYDDIRGSSAGAGWPASSAVDATSFLGKLRAKTGLQDFDLPTEAQWEYACRAGTTTALNSGKNLTSTGSDANMAEVGRYWYNGGSSSSTSGDTSVGTAKVGSYAPNAWGLYDMHGNVYEWCLDWYTSSLSAATDPVGAASGSYRSDRGGSWSSDAQYCRSANRDFSSPSGGYDDFGFRLSRTLAQ